MDTNPTNRKAVEDLTVGEHVSDAQGVHEVMHRFPFRNGDGRPAIALTLRPLGNGEPWVARHPEGHRLHVATDDEVRDFHDAGRRMALANVLHQLVDDIVGKQLPLPKYTLFFSAGVMESREALDRWADYLGAEVKGGVAGDLIPSVGIERPVVDSLRISIRAQAPSVPEPAPVVEQEHRHVGGSAGGPGENSAECACGVTYAGFDTHAEAAELIARHVAEEAAKAAEPQDGHVYSCCGKTGRISRHEPWCEVNKAAADAQPAGE